MAEMTKEDVHVVVLLASFMSLALGWVMVNVEDPAMWRSSAVLFMLQLFALVLYVSNYAFDVPERVIAFGDPERAVEFQVFGLMLGAVFGLGRMVALPLAITPLVAFYVVVISPIVEELFFRGTLMPLLAGRLSAAGGYLLSSVAFSAYHYTLYVAEPVALAWAFVFGLVMAVVVDKLESVTPAIIGHVVTNFFVLVPW